MGVSIAKYRTDTRMVGHIDPQDDFAIDSDGRLVPHPGEHFETMPLGSLDVIAFALINNAYQQNPYTIAGMSWEISFSNSRVAFFSPQTSGMVGVVKARQEQTTLGFYQYPELRSLSLGSGKEPDGAYVSLAFVLATPKINNYTVGIRVQGSAANLQAFSTMLVVKFTEFYVALSRTTGFDITVLGQLFEGVNNFNWQNGTQTDYFITANQNTMDLKISFPNI